MKKTCTQTYLYYLLFTVYWCVLGQVPDLDSRIVTPCTTRKGDDGFCLHKNNCFPLINESSSTIDYANECGEGNVCCTRSASFVETKKPNDFVSIREIPPPEECGLQNPAIDTKIIGGEEASLGEFPWMARLIYKNKENTKTFACGGFLIAPRFVLTAAHCLESEQVKQIGPVFEVQLGEHNTQTEIDCNSKNTICADKPQVFLIEKYIVHPSYNKTYNDYQNDIGLISLKKESTITNYVSPICLLENPTIDLKTEYWITGWGRTETQFVSPVKKKLNLPYFSHTNCVRQFGLLKVTIIDKQICAGNRRDTDACKGDSGGPLMVVRGNKWFAAGIVSFGWGCARRGWPGVYTNVTSYLSWINKTISGNKWSEIDKLIAQIFE